MKKIMVAGAGGFIGHSLVKYLKQQKCWVRGVDTKPPRFEPSPANEFLLLDLKNFDNCLKACKGMEEVFQFSADMGGIGHITSFRATLTRNNALINMNMLEAAYRHKVKNYLFPSSACIYPVYLQKGTNTKPLKEEDAYPADPTPGYGWEKLQAEEMCKYYREDLGFKAHVVRFNSIYGPLCTYDGGKEKSIAAICRKIALAKDKDEIEVWGDGKQVRAYCFIDDCLRGICKFIESDFYGPVNLSHDRLVNINELVDIVARIEGKKIKKRHDLSKPQGVKGRNINISLIKKTLSWEPTISLEDGLKKTYFWIKKQLET